jgi:hypothetical protein
MLLVRGVCIFLVVAAANLLGDSLIPPLTPKQVEQTRKLLEDFQGQSQGSVSADPLVLQGRHGAATARNAMQDSGRGH